MPRPAKSPQLVRLEAELSRLKKLLLPGKFNPTGSYPDRVFSKTLSYRVLVHAEIEEYIEERVWELAVNSNNALIARGTVNRVIASILAFSGQTFEEPPDSLAPHGNTPVAVWNQKVLLEEKVQFALNAFAHRKNQNHGIVEKNIIDLLLTVGVKPSDIDPVWLASMEAFGRARGLVAHRSAVYYRTINLPDPRSEYQTVKTLLSGLRDLDLVLNQLLP